MQNRYPTGYISTRFVRYCGAGLVGTTVHFLILYWLVTQHQFNPVVASVFGFTSGAVINFSLNAYLVFKKSDNVILRAPRFFTVALMGAVLNTVMMHIGTNLFLIHFLIAQCVTTSVVTYAGYALNKIWTFS